MIVEFSTEVERWQEEGPDDAYLKGEPYSYRGSEGGSCTNVTAAVAQDQSKTPAFGYCTASKDLPVQPGDTVYVVVATYTTGDTFGSDGGQTQILDAFVDPDEAAELAGVAKEADQYSFEHNGQNYRPAWIGYFEHLDDMSVWEVVVKNHHNYTRFGDASYSFKRGH